MSDRAPRVARDRRRARDRQDDGLGGGGRARPRRRRDGARRAAGRVRGEALVRRARRSAVAAVPEELRDASGAAARGARRRAAARRRRDRPPERRLVGTALLSLLRELAADATVVVAVDDFQWLDRAVGGGGRVRAAAADRRAGPRDPLRALAVQAGRSSGLDATTLCVERSSSGRSRSPRSTASSSTQLGRTFPRPTLVRIAQASGGNPLYALEIARLLDAGRRARSRRASRSPTSLAGAGRARVRVAPAATRDALLRAAALAQPDLRLVDGRRARGGRGGGARSDRRRRAGSSSSIRCSRRPSTRPRRSIAGARRTERSRRRSSEPGGTGTAPRARLRRPGRAGRARGRGGCARCPPARRAGHRGRADRARAPARRPREARPSTRCGSISPSTSTWRATSSAPPTCSSELRRDARAGRPARPRAACPRRDRLLAQGRVGSDRTGGGSTRGTPAIRSCRPAARRRSRCTRAPSTSRRRPPQPAPRSSCSTGCRRPSRASSRRRSSARVRADLFLGEGFDARGRRAGARARARRPSGGRRTSASSSSSASGCATSTTSTVRGLSWRRRSRRRATRATTRRSRTSCSTAMIVETWAGEWGEAGALAERMGDAFAQQGVESGGRRPVAGVRRCPPRSARRRARRAIAPSCPKSRSSP